MFYKRLKDYHLLICFLSFLFIPPILSCGENQELIRQRQEYELQKKQRQEEYQKKALEINAVLSELKNKYSDPIDLTEEQNCNLFARAYNNPEENPQIRNSTDSSANEFEYQKDKDIYQSIRSQKYAIMSFNIYGNQLNKYDFDKKNFALQFKRYTIMAPGGGVIYTKKRPPHINLIVQNDPEIKIYIEPELAEKFKNGITNTANSMSAMYGLETQYKDLARLYVVFRINGKHINGDIQHISVDIADYQCYWYIDAGKSISGHITASRSCIDPIECASEIKIFKKQ